MSPRAVVIGIGEPLAGDDGVGPAVVEALGREPLPEGTRLERLREASAIISRVVESRERIVIVDAAVQAGAPGTVHVVDTSAVDVAALSGLSSHGLGVGQAIELGRTLAPERSAEIWLVAVSIRAPSRHREGLSAAVAAAVPQAARAVRRLLDTGPVDRTEPP